MKWKLTNNDRMLTLTEATELEIDQLNLTFKRQTELLENQITFFSQCIDTLDRLGFSIKNKIQVEEFNHKNF